MIKPLEAPTFTRFTSPPEMPLKQKFALSDVEDKVVTIIAVFLLSGMFLAYICLCCHLWGIHVRIIQLVRSIGTGPGSIYSGRDREMSSRPSISMPIAGRYRQDYLTPPPRYSAVSDFLPSYSCALQRMLHLTKGPILLRFLVYVEPNFGDNSVFSGSPPPSAEETNQRNDVVTDSSGNWNRSVAFDNNNNVINANAASSPDAVITIVNNYSNADDLDQSPLKNTDACCLQSTTNKNNSPEANPNSSSDQESNIVNESFRLATRNISGSSVLPTIVITSNSPPPDLTETAVIANPLVFTGQNGGSYHGQPDTESFLVSPNIPHSSFTFSPLEAPAETSIPPSMGTSQSGRPYISMNGFPDMQCSGGIPNRRRNFAMTTTDATLQVIDQQSGLFHPFSSPILAENELAGNSIKLLVKGIGGVEQIMYALKCAPNCYVAHWPIPSKDVIDSEGLEVLVDGQNIEEIYLACLNVNGQSIAIAQLLPSPTRSSVGLHSRSPILPPQNPPPPIATTSTPLSAPPLYSP